MRGRSLTALVLTVVVQGPLGVVSADDMTAARRWTSSAWCVDEIAVMSHTSGGDGISRGTVRTYTGNCSTEINRDVQFIAEKVLVWFRRNNGDKPALCVYTDYYYNPKLAWAMQLTLSYPATPWCGQGWYETEAGGWLWYDGHWHGGSVLSGQHFLNV